MMGIKINGPANIYGDKQPVLSNTTFSDPKITKRYHSISYHAVRERVPRNEWLTGCIRSEDNLSETLTKTFPAVKKRTSLVGHYFYYMA